MSRWEQPPQLRDDLVVVKQDVDGAPYYVIKDPVTQRYFRLREPEYFLVRQFNGQHNFDDIARIFKEKFELSVSPSAVEKFAEKIDSLYFFEGTRAEYEVSSARFFGQKKSLLSRLLFFKLKAFDPEPLLNKLLPPLRFLYSPLSLLAMSIVIIAGLFTYAGNFDGFKFSPGQLFNVGSLLVITLSLGVIIILHEFAHALTCRYHGGQVREMGFLLLYFQICFYSNLSDSWLFTRKSQRLAVIWAGIFAQMVLFAVAVFGWRVTVVGTDPNQFFWLTANVCFISLLFNFNPLIKLDGYYFLSEWVNIPNLRSKSFLYLKNGIKKMLGAPYERAPSTARERRIFRYYVLFAGLYSVLLIGLIAFIVYRFLVDNLGGFGFILFLLLVVVIFKNPVQRAVQFITGPDVMKAVWTKPRNLIIGGIIIILVIVVLFLIPFPRRAGGDISIQPSAEFTITLLSGPGLLELNLREGGRIQNYKTEHIHLASGDLTVLELTPLKKEGELVRRNDTLALIASNQVTASLNAARAELERLRGELALKKAPPKQSQVDEVEAEIGAAQTNLQKLRKDAERNESLLEKNLISRQEFENTELNLELAESRLREARARLDLITSPPKPEEITILESQIITQEANIAYLISQESAQVITCPIEGEVVALYRNNLLFKIADMIPAEASVPVLDSYLDFIETGAPVKTRVRSFPDEIFDGEVIYISRSADLKNSPDSRARFQVLALMDNERQLLRDGMSGYAKISCGKASLFQIILERVMAFIRVEFWSWW